jgi:hypothetical protein
MADKSSKDLDFDELHKAVSVLMDKAQKNKAKKSNPVSKPVDELQGSGPANDMRAQKASELELVDDGKIAVNVKRPLLALTTAHKVSHGRAMDVVGPRDSRPTLAPTAAVKRQAASLQPPCEVKPEPFAPAIVPDPKPAGEPTKDSNELNEALASLSMQNDVKPMASPTMTHQKSELVELATDSSNSKTEDAIPVADEPEDQSVEDMDSTDITTDKEPENTSPFVTTKVEKRPLGAYADVAGMPEQTKKSEPEDSSATVTEPDGVDKDQTDIPNPLPSQPQPEELGPAVVAVESSEPEFNRLPDTNGEQDLRTMAIPQQYKEPESAEDDSPRPVFDTKEYHPAIEAHTGAHHSSAGTWTMGVVLLLLLVGLLVAVYYFMTGSLDFSALFSY